MAIKIENAEEEVTSIMFLRTGSDFYAPFGVSTDPNRMRVMRLRVDVLDDLGQVIEPWSY